MNEKYLGTSKKKIAVGSVVGAVVLLFIVGPNKATPSPVPEVEEPEVAAVVVAPVIEETILEMTIVSEKAIPELNISGHLLVPYEHFMNFGSAFNYAMMCSVIPQLMMGIDSTSFGEVASTILRL